MARSYLGRSQGAGGVLTCKVLWTQGQQRVGNHLVGVCLQIKAKDISCVERTSASPDHTQTVSRFYHLLSLSMPHKETVHAGYTIPKCTTPICNGRPMAGSCGRHRLSATQSSTRQACCEYGSAGTFAQPGCRTGFPTLNATRRYSKRPALSMFSHSKGAATD